MDEFTPLRKAARAAHTKTLSVATYQAHASAGDPHPTTFIRRHGSWEAACVAAGLEPARAAARRYSDDEVTAAIRACHADLQGPVSTSLYRNWQEHHPDQPPAQIIASRLERLAAAAGIAVSRSRVRSLRFSDEQLLDAVRTAAKAVTASGHQGISILDYRDWRDAQKDRKQLPSPESIRDRFGSWPKARSAALGDSDKLQALRTAYANDPNLSSRSYDLWARSHDDAPGADWFAKQYGTWSAALAAAGITVRR